MSRFYLAYGCNLNLEVIAGRCPDAQAVCPVMINGYRLWFGGGGTGRWGRGGVATLISDPDCNTPGALYQLTEEDESTMDKLEGLATAVYLKDEGFADRITGFTAGDSDLVFTYLLTDPQPLNHPPVRYIRAINQGYLDWDLAGHPLNLR